jgi:hypothetical protein
MHEDKVTLVSAGDCIHQRAGLVGYLFEGGAMPVSPIDLTIRSVNGENLGMVRRAGDPGPFAWDRG